MPPKPAPALAPAPRRRAVPPRPAGRPDPASALPPADGSRTGRRGTGPATPRFRPLLGASLALLLAATAARADVTLKLVEVVTSPERTDTLKSIVAGFEAAHPGIRVAITSLRWNSAFATFAAMVSAGDVPDVVEMPDRWLSLYADSGRLESLEPYLAAWDQTAALAPRALELARSVGRTAYTLPYGFYLRALFFNKALFARAGIAGPPRTLDEFAADARKISALPGASGYCLRGGPGGLNAWMMFGAAMAGSADLFRPDGSSTLSEPGWVRGSQFLIDLYQGGAAPRDSIAWGFEEVVAGFSSGACAMLDQEPDALIAIERHMKPDEFGVAPMPKGPSGRAYPTLGFAGWSIFKSSRHKDLAWDLVAALDGPAGNLAWNKRIGTMPIYPAAERDPFYGREVFRSWFAELGDGDVVPLVLPTSLPDYGYFADVVAVKSGQQALSGQITAEALNRQWAAVLTLDKRKADAGR